MPRFDKILALIPARSGSKSIPRKNLLPLSGHPLLAFSIAAARLSRRIPRVLVSTDSPEIAATARQYGAEAPFLRPAELAADQSLDVEFYRHALDWLDAHEGYRPDAVVHLRPTTPLRLASEIDRAISALEDDHEATALRSAHLFDKTGYKLFRLDGDYCSFFGKEDFPGQEYYNWPRQKLPATYIPNGYVDVLLPQTLSATGLLHGPKIHAFITEPIADIDTMADVPFAEELARREDFEPLLAKLKELKGG